MQADRNMLQKEVHEQVAARKRAEEQVGRDLKVLGPIGKGTIGENDWSDGAERVQHGATGLDVWGELETAPACIQSWCYVRIKQDT